MTESYLTKHELSSKVPLENPPALHEIVKAVERQLKVPLFPASVVCVWMPGAPWSLP